MGTVHEHNRPPRRQRLRAPPGEPATVANLAKNGHDLSTRCRTCQSFGATILYEDLLERFGPGFVVMLVDGYLRCTRCGERNGETRIHQRDRTGMTPGL